MLHNLQTDSNSTLANKLKTRHIHFYDEKMKVFLAVQVLSHSVAAALKTLNSNNIPGFKNANATSEFCRIMNEIFHSLNCKNKFDAPKARQPVKKENLNDLKLKIKFFTEYVDNLKFKMHEKVWIDPKNKGKDFPDNSSKISVYYDDEKN